MKRALLLICIVISCFVHVHGSDDDELSISLNEMLFNDECNQSDSLNCSSTSVDELDFGDVKLFEQVQLKLENNQDEVLLAEDSQVNFVQAPIAAHQTEEENKIPGKAQMDEEPPLHAGEIDLEEKIPWVDEKEELQVALDSSELSVTLDESEENSTDLEEIGRRSGIEPEEPFLFESKEVIASPAENLPAQIDKETPVHADKNGQEVKIPQVDEKEESQVDLGSFELNVALDESEENSTGLEEITRPSEIEPEEPLLFESKEVIAPPADNLLRVKRASWIEISGRMLYVEGKPFFVKGVDYSPIPIGEYPGSPETAKFGQPITRPDIYKRDLPLIKGMGANTIRTYRLELSSLDGFKDFLDEVHAHGLYVAVGIWIPPNADYSNPAVRESIKGNVLKVVKELKDYPAVLMWVVGNELNFRVADPTLAFSLVNETRQAIHHLEGSNWHPVTSAVADINLNDYIPKFDYSIDLWSAQVYRGKSFYTFFSDYATRSEKPLVIAEFGIDAYDSAHNVVDEASQADWNSALMHEIIENKDVCSGGIIFSFLDEWWKAGNPFNQLSAGDPANAPDGWGNAAYYGLFAVSKGETVDKLTPRAAYSALQTTFLKENPLSHVQAIPRQSRPILDRPTPQTNDKFLPIAVTLFSFAGLLLMVVALLTIRKKHLQAKKRTSASSFDASSYSQVAEEAENIKVGMVKEEEEESFMSVHDSLLVVG